MKRCLFIVAALLLTGLFATPYVQAYTDNEGEVSVAVDCSSHWGCPNKNASDLESLLADFKAPELTPPPTPVVIPKITISKSITQTVTYDVTTRGSVTADLSQFKAYANETLNSSLGWSRLGVRFNEVASGGQFTLVLSEASEVPSFSTGCSADYSCNVGRYVIINQDRWLGATPAWNNAGGDLRNYQHMVINHETGHWLGHGHENCPAAGQAAAVMQQQSISLQGCKFNPWPLDSEIWSSRLGI